MKFPLGVTLFQLYTITNYSLISSFSPQMARPRFFVVTRIELMPVQLHFLEGPNPGGFKD